MYRVFKVVFALILLTAVYVLIIGVIHKSPRLVLDEAYEPVVASVMAQARPHVTEDQYCNYEAILADAKSAEGWGPINCWYKQILKMMKSDLAVTNPSLALEVEQQQRDLGELEEQLNDISPLGEKYPFNLITVITKRAALIDARDKFLASW